MVSKVHKKSAIHEKLQLLRSITNSHARMDSSILLDASKYIEELKHKVQTLNQDIASGQISSYEINSSLVIEENGERIDVHMAKQAIKNWSDIKGHQD